MQSLIYQRVVRLTCGLGLLTLPAVQQKVCMLPEPAEPTRAGIAESTPDTQDQTAGEKRERPTLKLIALLPDVTPPRWPAHVHPSLLQRERPLESNGWRSDCVDRDRPNGSTCYAFWALPNTNRIPALPGPQLGISLQTQAACRLLLGSVISPTGPPSCI